MIAGEPLDLWPEGINADLSPDAPPAKHEDWWAESGQSFPDLRTVLVCVLVKTATHAGHLDAVRELLDGKQYLSI